MARSFRRKHTQHPIAELNVTNLIDLGFMLLIIFMVVATVSKEEQTLPVNLPIESKSIQAKPDPDDKFESITIKADGRYVMHGRTLTLVQLAGELSGIAGQPKPPVFRIRSDAAAPMQHFVSLTDELKKKNLFRITIDTQTGN